MTLDEAIKHCLEQAHKLQDKADRVGGDESRQCMECAADHIQLAEWLVELKDLRAEQHEQGVFIKELMKHSAADVQPVKRGRWEYIRNVKLSGTIKLCECNQCHNKIFGGLSYCGNCGARMDGDTNG